MKKVTEPMRSQAAETLTVRLLRDRARDRAASLKWNIRAVLIIYAIFLTIALLQLERTNTLLTTSLAVIGLLTFWLVSWLRWRKLEKRLYQEILREYEEILSCERHNPNPMETMEPTDSPLTERELEVLTGMAAGRANKEIANALGISLNTVKVHVYRIFEKLNVNDRTSAVLVSLSRGWIRNGCQQTTDSSTRAKEAVASR